MTHYLEGADTLSGNLALRYKAQAHGFTAGAGFTIRDQLLAGVLIREVERLQEQIDALTKAATEPHQQPAVQAELAPPVPAVKVAGKKG